MTTTTTTTTTAIPSRKSGKRDLKAFVRYDGTGRVVPSSVILARNKPRVGHWVEIEAYECCNYSSTTTTAIPLQVYCVSGASSYPESNGTYIEIGPYTYQHTLTGQLMYINLDTFTAYINTEVSLQTYTNALVCLDQVCDITGGIAGWSVLVAEVGQVPEPTLLVTLGPCLD